MLWQIISYLSIPTSRLVRERLSKRRPAAESRPAAVKKNPVKSRRRRSGLPSLRLLLILLLGAIWWLNRNRREEAYTAPRYTAPRREKLVETTPPEAQTPAGGPPQEIPLVSEAEVEALSAPPEVMGLETEGASAPPETLEIHQEPAAPAEGAPPADDLTRIEGIGPKISSLLQAAGITSFARLAETDQERLAQILQDANLRLAKPGTWPEQARLAAAGDWDALAALQDELKAGRRS